jgi:hypothetical protein
MIENGCRPLFPSIYSLIWPLVNHTKKAPMEIDAEAFHIPQEVKQTLKDGTWSAIDKIQITKNTAPKIKNHGQLVIISKV